jgi:hypothetical protein
MYRRIALLAPLIMTSIVPSAHALDIFVADHVIVKSGHDLFEHYCTRCHGADGAGATADSGKETIKAPSLLTLAKRNGGTFPIWGAYEVVDGSKVVAEHRSRAMPIWGEEFAKSRKITKENKDAIVRGRILAILAYLSTIQEK